MKFDKIEPAVVSGNPRINRYSLAALAAFLVATATRLPAASAFLSTSISKIAPANSASIILPEWLTMQDKVFDFLFTLIWAGTVAFFFVHRTYQSKEAKFFLLLSAGWGMFLGCYFMIPGLLRGYEAILLSTVAIAILLAGRAYPDLLENLDQEVGQPIRISLIGISIGYGLGASLGVSMAVSMAVSLLIGMLVLPPALLLRTICKKSTSQMKSENSTALIRRDAA